MRIFLMVAAVLIGLANATLYSLIGNNTFDNLFEWQRDPWSLYLLYASCAVFVGLLISAGLLKFGQKVMKEGFFARYGLMVLAISIGGAVLAVYPDHRHLPVRRRCPGAKANLRGLLHARHGHHPWSDARGDRRRSTRPTPLLAPRPVSGSEARRGPWLHACQHGFAPVSIQAPLLVERFVRARLVGLALRALESLLDARSARRTRRRAEAPADVLRQLVHKLP